MLYIQAAAQTDFGVFGFFAKGEIVTLNEFKKWFRRESQYHSFSIRWKKLKPHLKVIKVSKFQTYHCFGVRFKATQNYHWNKKG